MSFRFLKNQNLCFAIIFSLLPAKLQAKLHNRDTNGITEEPYSQVNEYEFEVMDEVTWDQMMECLDDEEEIANRLCIDEFDSSDFILFHQSESVAPNKYL